MQRKQMFFLAVVPEGPQIIPICGLRKNICDHLGGGWVIAARDAFDIDAVLRDGFSNTMESQVNVPRSLTGLIVSIVSRSFVVDVHGRGHWDVLAPAQFMKKATGVLHLDSGCAQGHSFGLDGEIGRAHV